MPRNLVSEVLHQGLYTRIVGRRILFFQELSSTMDEAARQAAAGAPDGTVVVAETQRTSRGRWGRSWVSQPGNLYLSVLFYPDFHGLPYLSQLGGVALTRAITRTCGLSPRIKWPNDVLVDGKKVAGILVESAIEGERVGHAIIGIGVNVALDVAQFGELAGYATNLNCLASKEVARDGLLRRLLHEMDLLYLELRQGCSPMQEWRELLDTLGQQVQVTSRRDSYDGVAEGVDDLGNLLLRLDDGQLITLTAGDVSLHAPLA